MSNREKLENLIRNIPREDKRRKLTAEEIAEHLDNNCVIVLPCAIGETVWIVSKNSTEPYPAKFKLDDLSQIGRRIFLTRESALRYMRRERVR